MLERRSTYGVVDAIVGMSAVKRFHGRNTIKQQTLADHSGRVAQIAFFLALEFYEGDYSKVNYVATLGLFHDLPESLLECDIPTPVKLQKGIGPKLKQIETEAVKRIFPDSPYLQNLAMEVASEDDFSLMKLADLLDLGLYIWEEKQLGNKSLDPLLEMFFHLFDSYPTVYRDLAFAQACRVKIAS